MQKVNLNMIPGGVLPVINVSQYDEGRQFQLALFDGASTYDLTGKTVTILVGKTDGNGCAYGVSDLVNGVPVIAVSTNTVTVTTPVQMTAAAGDNMAEIRVETSTADVRSLNFILRCEPAALDPGTPLSATQIPAIERAGWDAVDHYPYIDAVTNHWLVWNVSTGQYDDTGVSAGGGGVTDYGDLTSKPQINGVQLVGNRTSADLGLATDATMTGASSGAAGAKGLVPAPAAGDQDKVLHGDGSWRADKDTDTLAGLTDTSISSPTNDQVLKYDSSTGKWTNGNGGGGGSSTLAGLSDTDIDTPTDGQPLTYDANDSKWKNGGIILTANGGTGNADGYVRAGQLSGTTMGTEATAEGHHTTASGTYSHAEGEVTVASGQYGSHAEGSQTTASGLYAHAEGSDTTASGTASHAEGYHNTASNGCTHAEGAYNTVSGHYAHVGGYGNEAGYDYQTAIGKYNKNASDSLFEVGNGTNNTLAARSNAIAVKTDGRIIKNETDAFAAASNLAPVEMTRTMTSNHAAGSFLFVAADDQFYQVGSSQLSSGATLTPGSNATAKSVADVLSSLNSNIANIRCISMGTVSFTNGSSDEISVSGVTTSSRCIAQRATVGVNAYIVHARATSAGKVTFYAYDTNSKTPRTGNLSDIILLVDNR